MWGMRGQSVDVAGQIACAERLHLSAWHDCGEFCLFYGSEPSPALPCLPEFTLACRC